MSYDAALAARLRATVSELAGGEVAEKAMFGGLAFLVDGHMAVAASAGGGLLLRVDPAQADALLELPHAEPFQMRGRPVEGWLRIDGEGVRTETELRAWATRGVTRARSLPPRS